MRIDIRKGGGGGAFFPAHPCDDANESKPKSEVKREEEDHISTE